MVCAGVIIGIPMVVETISFFRLVFCTVIHFRNLPLVAKAVIMICCIIRYTPSILSGRTRLTTVFFFGTAVGTLVYTYTKIGFRDMSKVDYMFLVLSIVGSFTAATGHLVYHHVVLPRLFDEWLLAFGPGWSHPNRLTWFGYGQSIWNWATKLLDILFP